MYNLESTDKDLEVSSHLSLESTFPMILRNCELKNTYFFQFADRSNSAINRLSDIPEHIRVIIKSLKK